MNKSSIPPIIPDLALLRGDFLHLPTRSIFIEGTVTVPMSCWVARALHLLEINPKEPINIYLTSTGGEIGAGLGIYDLIRACKSVVRIIGYGEICSVAVAILSAGDERILMPNTHVMIHPGSLELSDNHVYATMKKAKDYKRFFDSMYRIIGHEMGISLDKMKELYSMDTWFTAKQAVRVGLADRVSAF